jgi:uncharacterized metal-binding protein
MKCALCKVKECYQGKDCLEEKIVLKAREMYIGKSYKILYTAAHIEAEYYMEKTRLEELILFAKEMGYKRLGIAFCIGLENEARVVHEILARDFEVHSVCCKVCGIEKDEFDLDKFHSEGYETACNPIGQAIVLNQEETELNIILGLCIGHDILFIEHSKSPVTTLAVKDRVLAHNPLGAIYSNYYLENRFNLGDKGDKKNEG